MKSRVFIIGYGEMGHAMAFLLDRNHDLSIYDSRPVAGLVPVDFDKEATQADIILLCVPATPHQTLLERLRPLIQKQCICLSIAKGLDEQGRTPAQIYAQVFGGLHACCLLYGPMISEDIRADRYAFAQLGCADVSVYNSVCNLFRNTRLYIQRSNDIPGISWSVVLKNVYAIGFGIADGLGLGDNTRGFLAVTALQELGNIMRHMGGQAETPLHLAGLGDLITTATSEGSHHHALGLMLAREETANIAGEGIHTLDMVEKYRLFDTTPFPLYSLIRGIVLDPVRAAEKFADYIDHAHGIDNN